MNPYYTAMIWLIVAIVSDVVSTIYMAKSEAFTQLGPTIIGGFLYTLSFVACVFALKHIQAGPLYVLWAGLGAVITTALAKVMLEQSLDNWAWAGLICISIGLVCFTKSAIDV